MVYVDHNGGGSLTAKDSSSATSTNRRQSASAYQDGLKSASKGYSGWFGQENNLSSADHLAQIETAYSSKENRLVCGDSPAVDLGEDADNDYETTATGERVTAATSSSNVNNGFGVAVVVSVIKPKRAVRLKVNNGRGGSQNLIDQKTLKNILELQDAQDEFGFLQIDQIGICGIPSLYMNMEGLIKERHI